MYTETNKGFTIITNFGCDNRCKYCITRHHPILKDQVTDELKIDWNYLGGCIAESSAPTVNLSGGGDPFYEWEKHRIFYFKVHELTSTYGKGLDIHTRIIPNDSHLIRKFRKIALSIEYQDEAAFADLSRKIDSLLNLTQIRVINVLDARMSVSDCQKYIEKMKSIGVKQITFRQMFGNRKAAENFNSIKNEIHEPGVLFLKDGEYHNYYFTTDNKVYPYFFGYSENDRQIWKKKYEDVCQSCN